MGPCRLPARGDIDSVHYQRVLGFFQGVGLETGTKLTLHTSTTSAPGGGVNATLRALSRPKRFVLATVPSTSQLGSDRGTTPQDCARRLRGGPRTGNHLFTAPA
eukprot:86915-Chlamydomonas_euryale.AAC.3